MDYEILELCNVALQGGATIRTCRLSYSPGAPKLAFSLGACPDFTGMQSSRSTPHLPAASIVGIAQNAGNSVERLSARLRPGAIPKTKGGFLVQESSSRL